MKRRNSPLRPGHAVRRRRPGRRRSWSSVRKADGRGSMYIFKAAVVGAGTMGAEIAQVISFSGLPVVLKDVDQGMLDKGMATIREIYQGRVDKGKMSAGEMEGKMALIEPALTYDGFGDVDIVIEAVPEKMGLKKAVLAELAGVLPGDHHLRQQHLGPLDQRDGRGHRPAAKGDRHALLQPGPRHEAGRDHPRPGHHAGDGRRRGDVHRVAAQDRGGGAGVPGLPGQPPADALPERGDLLPAGGCGHRHRDRRRRWSSSACRWAPSP